MHACTHAKHAFWMRSGQKDLRRKRCSQRSRRQQTLSRFCLNSCWSWGKRLIRQVGWRRATCMHACGKNIQLLAGVCFRTNWSHTRTKENVLRSSGHRSPHTAHVTHIYCFKLFRPIPRPCMYSKLPHLDLGSSMEFPDPWNSWSKRTKNSSPCSPMLLPKLRQGEVDYIKCIIQSMHETINFEKKTQKLPGQGRERSPLETLHWSDRIGLWDEPVPGSCKAAPSKNVAVHAMHAKRANIN